MNDRNIKTGSKNVLIIISQTIGNTDNWKYRQLANTSSFGMIDVVLNDQKCSDENLCTS